ncbi:hypothetical protein KOW79_015042 [Hemibagrus wyckioides]|uniref:Uncharacterized protein n=1 Tax=Hemibagrus wyckioides TaxID=337641 RepID=A0A9D3NI62_9TELE|nr:hypothetical protein KOW79_015042 [Hemibagrus wyckioides]
MEPVQDSELFLLSEKVPVQCLDDPFGFNAVVVYGHESVPLIRCTPFLTVYRTQQMANERPRAEAANNYESGQEMSNADNHGRYATTRPVRPEDTDGHNHLIFSDGGSPLTMATGGIGNYKPRQMESQLVLEEEERDKHPRTRMKKDGKRGGKKSRRKQRR